MQDLSDKWLAMVNAHAGSGKTVHLWKKAKSELQKHGIDFVSDVTRHELHATEMTYEAACCGCRKFIAVGGDGTVHEVLGGIMAFVEGSGAEDSSAGFGAAVSDCEDSGSAAAIDERRVGEAASVSLSDFTLAVIPIGSGNDWIKSHNIPLDVEDAVKLIAAGSFSMQDVIRATVLPVENAAAVSHGTDGGDKSDTVVKGGDCVVKDSPDVVKDVNGVAKNSGSVVKISSDGPENRSDEKKLIRPNVSYMVNVGGIGLDSRICDTVNEWKKKGRRGSMIYVNSLIYNFFRYNSMNVEVECDGEIVYRGEVYTIAFGNGKYSGGGLPQTPEAVLDDGLLDMTLIPRLSKLRYMREIPKLFPGKLLTVKEVIAVKARAIVVRPIADDREIVEVDGDIIGRVPVRFDVCPGQLRVLHRFPSSLRTL